MAERTPVKFTAKMNATIDATVKEMNQRMNNELIGYARAAMDGMALEGSYKIDLAKREYVPVEDKPNVTNT